MKKQEEADNEMAGKVTENAEALEATIQGAKEVSEKPLQKPAPKTIKKQVAQVKEPTMTDVMKMEALPAKQLANSIDMASSLSEKRTYAIEMIKSGLLPTALATPDQLEDEDLRDRAIGGVIAVVEYGREMGITPWVALHGMHVVSGKVVMGIHMYLGLALKNDIMVDVVDDYKKIYNASKALVDIVTTVEITRKYPQFNNLIKTHKFTKGWSEIKKAGLDTRDNYLKRPTTMLRTRCITEALRLYAADIFMGTFETSEMLDSQDLSYTVDDEGNAIYK